LQPENEVNGEEFVVKEEKETGGMWV